MVARIGLVRCSNRVKRITVFRENFQPFSAGCTGFDGRDPKLSNLSALERAGFYIGGKTIQRAVERRSLDNLALFNRHCHQIMFLNKFP